MSSERGEPRRPPRPPASPGRWRALLIAAALAALAIAPPGCPTGGPDEAAHALSGGRLPGDPIEAEGDTGGDAATADTPTPLDLAQPDVVAPTCGAGACPPLDGYAVTCNDRSYCAYTPSGPGAGALAAPLIWVPPGSFPMGSADDHIVTFADGFWIDETEVTAATFAVFLAPREPDNRCGYGPGQGSCINPDQGAGGHTTVRWSDGVVVMPSDCQAVGGGEPASSCAGHPATGVTWYGAGACCAARGGGFRLCSETEWERAARGAEQRKYPWGDDPDPPDWGADGPRANCDEVTCEDGFTQTAPVLWSPAAAASPVGCRDMAGNAYEWVEDCAGASRDSGPMDGRAWTTGCTGAAREDRRVVRGGSWSTFTVVVGTSQAVRAAYVADGSDFDFDTGFRCCRSR